MIVTLHEDIKTRVTKTSMHDFVTNLEKKKKKKFLAFQMKIPNGSNEESTLCTR